MFTWQTFLLFLSALTYAQSWCSSASRDPYARLFAGHRRHPLPEPDHYILCNYNALAQQKCLHLVEVARNSSIGLPLGCMLQSNRTACIEAVQVGAADMLVLTGHGYKEARQAALLPAIFERVSNESLYLAIAPRNISLVEVQNAPIDVDLSKHRAFHAAAFFNLLRGHDICLFLRHASEETTIRIRSSAEYLLDADDILLCPDRSYAEPAQYQGCNFNANLQRAVFISRCSSPQLAYDLRRLFSAILQRFGADAQNGQKYNFFSSFGGMDNVIFQNNAVDFDFAPTYRNGVTEEVFSRLHCDATAQDELHDPRQLE